MQGKFKKAELSTCCPRSPLGLCGLGRTSIGLGNSPNSSLVLTHATQPTLNVADAKPFSNRRKCRQEIRDCAKLSDCLTFADTEEDRIDLLFCGFHSLNL